MFRAAPALVLFAIATLAPPATAARAAPRVVLIGADGASWNVIDPLVAAGEMPHLAALMRAGVHAEMATVEPVNSPTVWTAMATGQPPAVNGISSFVVDERDVRAPRVFEWLARQGLRVGLYQYLVTWPPRPLPNGFVIPGWLSGGPETAPASLAGVFRYDIAELRERRALHDHSFEELARKPAAFDRLVREREPDVAAVSFYALDNLSHRFWADSFPERFDADAIGPLDPAYAGTVQRAYRAFDAALGTILSALPEETAVVLVSDHGFQAHDGPKRRYKFDLGERLAEAVPPGKDYELQGDFGYLVVRVFPGPFGPREAASRAVERFLESITNDAGDPVFWVQPLDVAERPAGAGRGFVEWAKQGALRLLGRTLGTSLDDHAHGFVVGVPLPALDAAWAGGHVLVAGERVPIREVAFADSFTGDHFDTAVFVAAGPGIRTLPARSALGVMDVAPLIAWLAGGQVPEGLAGRLPRHLLDASALRARPLETFPADRWPRLPVLSPDAPDADLDGRLRALGYID